MTPDDLERVINELQTFTDDTPAVLMRFEETGIDDEIPVDYEIASSLHS